MIFTRLLYAWFHRPGPLLGGLGVTMYTRRGCHLCDLAWEQLQAARRRYGFVLEGVDVDGDPNLVREHGNWVPVVAVNGKVRFRGRVNPVLLRRLLEAAVKKLATDEHR